MGRLRHCCFLRVVSVLLTILFRGGGHSDKRFGCVVLLVADGQTIRLKVTPGDNNLLHVETSTSWY